MILGVSANTLRRKIAVGEVRAEQVQRPQGHVWKVYLEGVQHPGSVQQGAGQHAGQEAASVQPQPALEIQRAEVMASFLAPLLQQAIEPLVAELADTRHQVADQADRLGRLAAELDQARATIATLTAPKIELVAHGPPR